MATKTAHADCAHATTKLERERCRAARRKASLHPSPFAVEASAPASGTRVTPRASKPAQVRSGALTASTVNSAVWATALAVAGGNKSLIRIISATEVEVLHP